MKQKVKIGVVCFARKTFDFKAAFDIFQGIQDNLNKIEQVNWVIIPELIIEVSEAQSAAHKLASQEIDALICISGTFALGHLVLELHKVIHRPILLWGLDELPYDGGKIRLNSVCGVNLNASNLYKAGVKNFFATVGNDIDENWLDAIRVIKAFNTAHIGIIGYRAQGFFNLDVDELNLYNKTGILIDHFELQSVFNTEISQEEVEKRKKLIQSLFDSSKLSAEQLIKVAELTVKFDLFMKNNSLTALAIRCWPEFAASYGISPCAAMSVLQSENKILTCEGDILGSLSQLAHVAVGGETPFLADFSQVNFKEDFALLWHCGVAPVNLCDGECNCSLETYFAGGRGVTADFVLKPSKDLSILRIDYAPGEYRMFIQKGEVIPMEKELSGTYMKTIFKDGVKAVMDKIVYNGIAHHVSCVYGHYMEVFEVVGKLLKWSVIQ
jgi:L-fucose isomerase-like protein